MTQLGEAIAIGDILESDPECPFDHSVGEPPNIANEFEGNAKTLEDNMSAGLGTDRKAPEGATKTVCPNYDKKHAFWDGRPADQWPVEVEGHLYPVTCAAHHLIPAQETLKRATVLKKYMTRKSSKGKCYSNIGYDVNGAQNGVFLPGNYGVSSVGMSRSLWTSEPSAMGDSADDAPGPDGENLPPVKRPKTSSSKLLTGLRHQVDPANRKWQYVYRAMQLTPGQFHDRHADYSNKVLQIIEDIVTEYDVREKKLGCGKCKDKFAQRAEQGIPTPFRLIARLNAVSKRLSGYLDGRKWNLQLYTSKWGLAYMRAVKRKELPLIDATGG